MEFNSLARRKPPIRIFKDKRLGSGSYGVVCRASYGELPCASKLIQNVFFEDADPGVNALIVKFEQECECLRALRHPNIIQYLDTYIDPETRLPVLLMELMDESLTDFLGRSPDLPLPLSTEASLCRDVALALDYLHFNSITHRDLSSNNVLLVADRRAKVTDFGMSKLNRAQADYMTRCPGCMVYMPPEALEDPPSYTYKLDVFSFGVLTLQILTRKFPNPGPSTRKVEGHLFPTGVAHLPIPEKERRKAAIDLVNADHPLKALTLSCLEDREDLRPTTQELCQRVGSLVPQQGDTVDIVRRKDERIQYLEERVRILESEMGLLRKKSQELEDGARSEEKKVLEKHKQQLNEMQLSKQDLENKLKAAQMLNAELLDGIGAGQTIGHGDQEGPRVKTAPIVALGSSDARCVEDGSVRTSSSLLSASPEQMSRGVLGPNGRQCFFATSHTKIYSYDIICRRWECLKNYPCASPGLVVIRGALTGLGGLRRADGDTLHPTNILYTLLDNIWVEKYPCMLSRQQSPTSLCYKSLLLVISEHNPCVPNGVVLEMLNLTNLQWSYVKTALPRGLQGRLSIAASDINGCLYVAWTNANGPHVVGWVLKSLQPGGQVAKEIPVPIVDPPVDSSTISALQGQLICIGGCKQDNPSSEIYAYSSDKNVWLPIGKMCVPRVQPLVIATSRDSLFIVSGTNLQDTELVECIV